LTGYNETVDTPTSLSIIGCANCDDTIDAPVAAPGAFEALKLFKLGMPAEEFYVYFRRLPFEKITTALGDAAVASARGLQQSCLLHIRSGPAYPVDKGLLDAARQHPFQVIFRETESRG